MHHAFCSEYILCLGFAAWVSAFVGCIEYIKRHV